MFEEINKNKNWEFLCLYLQEKLVAVGCCNFAEKSYSPTVLGMDYDFNTEYKIYKKILAMALERAIEPKKNIIYLGLSADLEKRKFGAISISKVAYISVKDIFNFEKLELISGYKKLSDD